MRSNIFYSSFKCEVFNLNKMKYKYKTDTGHRDGLNANDRFCCPYDGDLDGSMFMCNFLFLSSPHHFKPMITPYSKTCSCKTSELTLG